MQPLNANDPPRIADPVPSGATPDPGNTVTQTSAPADGGTVTYEPAQGTEPKDTAPASVAALVSVPGYEIEGVLGRGGMGVVYKARHVTLKRTVALKMVLSGGHAGPRELARFRIEAEAVARLQHPNIVQIHEVGAADGHPYCALEFVAGGNLARELDGKPMLAREAAKLIEALARAMQLAHSRNVVHRDLKPANILLTLEGTPKITDFGLARQMDSDSGETQAGTVMGTPSYMAPEQASGRAHEAGPAADIYALGAILYDCLTGRPPFKGATVVETLDQVRTQEPLPPSRWQADVPLDLETICLKCLRKEPEKRYASAAELADELVRYQQGEPILARPVGRLERTVKWARRQPAAAALIGLAILLALGVVAGLWWQSRRVQEQQAVLLVEKLKTAEIREVPRLIEDMKPYRRWADPLLRELADSSPPQSRERLHAALALLPADSDQAGFLTERLLTATPDEFSVTREALNEPSSSVAEQLWRVLEDDAEDRGRRFRAACALATYTPADPRWNKVNRLIVNMVIAENPLLVGKWAMELRPARLMLLTPLIEVYRDVRRPANDRELAATLLSDYAADRPELLVELLLDAEPAQYVRLIRPLRSYRDQALPLLHRMLETPPPPVEKIETRDVFARRQAHAAVVLAQLGEHDAAWRLLRHEIDPSCRTYLTLALGRFGTDPDVIIHRLRIESNASARRALILSLGEYSAEQLAPTKRQDVVTFLLSWYRDDPDPGIHSAIDWLLRHGRRGSMPRKLDWGQAVALEQIDLERRRKPPGGRRWYVTGEGHTLAIVRDPQVFRMGSPDHEPGRQAVSESPQHRRQIPRSFAIGTKEVTIEQFQRFVSDISNGKRQHQYSKHYSPDPTGPVVGVTWFDAVAYCNWLSRKEGVPETEWCYPTAGIGDRMTMPEDFLKRKGYRLPTESEWEYACRAGAMTPRFYGSSPALVDEYAWNYKNSEDRAWPGGMLKPNDLGLFDVYGNVLEWCQDRLRAYPQSAAPGETHSDLPSPLDFMVPDSPLFARVLRGGSFGSRPPFLRSASRSRDRPGTRFDSVGFRVARTLE